MKRNAVARLTAAADTTPNGGVPLPTTTLQLSVTLSNDVNSAQPLQYYRLALQPKPRS